MLPPTSELNWCSWRTARMRRSPSATSNGCLAGGCSPGLGFLPREAFVSELGLRHFRARGMTLTDSDETVTAPLEDRVSPHLVRMAAGMLARSGPEATL